MSYLTKDEARKKWCPYIGSPGGGDTGCRGPNCMMWRWAADFTKYGANPPQEKGYCGLAGDPNPLVYVPPAMARTDPNLIYPGKDLTNVFPEE